MKTLNKILKLDKEKFKIPKCVQDIIPIKAIWEDGIFQVSKNKFSKSYKFMDINYAVASKEDKEAMFLEYSDLLNSLDVGAITKITINNRRINKLDFERTILLDESNDELNDYRKEYNKMLISQAKNANEIVQEKIITLSVYKKNVEEARNYFNRAGSELISRFNTLGSKCIELDAKERLRIAHDFYRTGEETSFRFDIHETMKKGHNFKDFICPDTIELERDHFKMGDRYGRVLFLKEYSSYINDDMVTELTDLNKNMMLSIDVIPIPMDEAVKEAENRRLGVETNITNWQRKQNAQNNFSAIIPYDMEQQRNDSKEMLDDLTIRDQRMFLGVITMVITEESKEKLESVTDAILKIASKNLCQLGILRFQQLDGLNTVLPFGVRKIDAVRTLTTESLAVFMPFKVQEIRHENGIFYGQNAISKNMIIADRRQLLNGNSFILGVSGSGKSFTGKQEITSIRLRDPNADIILIDPDLQDFREELLKQPEDEAKEIALAIELFTNGSLNTFAMNTNVNTSNSLICYDILELGKQLQPIGMLVVLDSILNRITANRTKGKNTYIFIDEIYLLFQYEYSANFLFTLWKRVRKYGAFCTGITQNVEDLLQSHTARTMLANSEFIIMLNQASTDRIELAKLLNISDLQMSYITNVGAGEGLIKVGSSLVPFVNKFPKNTRLYTLMTTKPGEGFNE